MAGRTSSPTTLSDSSMPVTGTELRMAPGESEANVTSLFDSVTA